MAVAAGGGALGERADPVERGRAGGAGEHAGPRAERPQQVGVGGTAPLADGGGGRDDLDGRSAGRHHRAQRGAAEAGRRALDRQDAGAVQPHVLAPSSVQPAPRGHAAGPRVELDVDQPERLGRAELGGEEGRDGARAPVQRVVTAPDRGDPGRAEHGRDGGGHDGGGSRGREVDPHGAGRAGGHRLAQDPVGLRRAGRHREHGLVPPLPGPERPLERGGVGGRAPGGARVRADVRVERVDLGSQVDPLAAGGDHVRRKTTPQPPSG